MAIPVIRVDGVVPISGWDNSWNEGTSLSICASNYAQGYRALKEAILDKPEVKDSIETGLYMLVTVNDHTFRARVRQTEGQTSIYVHPDDRDTATLSAAQISRSDRSPEAGKMLSPWKRTFTTDLSVAQVGSHTPGRQKLREMILEHRLAPHSIASGEWFTVGNDEVSIRARVRSTPGQNTPYVHRADEGNCLHLLRLLNRDQLQAGVGPAAHRLLNSKPSDEPGR